MSPKMRFCARSKQPRVTLCRLSLVCSRVYESRFTCKGRGSKVRAAGGRPWGLGVGAGPIQVSRLQALLLYILRFRVEALRPADSSPGLVTYCRA